MRIIVIGGRRYYDRALHNATTQVRPEHITLVHGDAFGADRLAASVAARAGWTTESHPADWPAHGKAAGLIRNQAMVRRAKAAGIPVRHIPTPNPKEP